MGWGAAPSMWVRCVDRCWTHPWSSAGKYNKIYPSCQVFVRHFSKYCQVYELGNGDMKFNIYSRFVKDKMSTKDRRSPLAFL